MSTFEQTLVHAGLRPRAIVADGRIRRCPTDGKPSKRNGWYVLRPDGSGSWGDWAIGSGDAIGHYGTDDVQIRIPTAQELAERESRKQRERAARIAAIRGARAAWGQALPMRRPHPYLERKGLSTLGTQGLRTRGELLVIPVLWDGRITSIQTISPDGEKRFWTGAPVKNGSYVLDRPRAALTAFCEGFATGLAIYQCVRHARVVVAFDAGNLIHVVERMKPTGSVVICADDDHGTLARRGINPGLEKARNAADLIGAGVAWPQDIEGTDFADMLLELGPTGAKRIERLIQTEARYVT